MGVGFDRAWIVGVVLWSLRLFQAYNSYNRNQKSTVEMDDVVKSVFS